MKTTEELLEMPGNDLLKYCESLKYFTIDKDDFNILKTSNIVITNITYDKVHKQFDLSYHFEDSSIYDDDIKRPIYWLSFNTCGNYCGLFESRQDAINAAKQHAKKEILEQIDSSKLQIKDLEKKIEKIEELEETCKNTSENLDDSLEECDLDLEDCIQKYKDKSEDYPSLLRWIAIQTFNKAVSPSNFFEMDEETAYDFNCWGHNSRWKNVFWDYLNKNTEKCLEKCKILNTLSNKI